MLSTGFLILSMMSSVFASGFTDRSNADDPDRVASTSDVVEPVAQNLNNNQNLALGKTATQAATFSNTADQAVDGNTDSFTWTWASDAWWEVDLGQVSQLNEVVIWGGYTGISDFHVLVSDTPFSSTSFTVARDQAGVSSFHYGGTVSQNTSTTIALDRTGRYVRIQRSGFHSIGLAEVLVMGGEEAPDDPAPLGTGTITHEWWNGISGTAVTDLTNSPDYPNSPDGSGELDRFSAPTNWSDNYGTRVRGYVHPPSTGDYTFWISSDDNGELWLSTDDNSLNKQLIASVSGWSSSEEWDKFPEQKSATIHLEAGNRYYIEALQKEGGGGDNLAVAWQIPGQVLAVIEGQHLSPAEAGPEPEPDPVDDPAPPAEPQNLALGKPATQATTFSNTADQAVDGNTDSFTWTWASDVWWEVDLGQVSQLNEVVIWGGNTGISDFHVLVSDTPFSSTSFTVARDQAGVSSFHYGGTVSQNTSTTIALDRTGRYVRIQRSGFHSFSLAEVLVMGGEEEDPFKDLIPLSELPIPGPDNLHAFDSNLSSTIDGEKVSYSEFVVDEQALVQLGKALFWDMQVGSDGVQACASCHFASGIDPRAKNQLNPGTNAGDNSFQIGTGVNYTLVADDFPFHEKADPADRHSSVLRDANDVASSQGVINSIFEGINEGSNVDIFSTPDDPIFNLNTSQAGVVNTRRVEPRNTPTSVNAVFNFLQFWDGRANNNFNGVTPFGNRDVNAKIVRMDGSAEPVQILMPLSSLASQAVGPPLSHFEMSAAGRSWPDIGKKLLADGILPLAGQLVDESDSHLGSLSNQHASSGATGLNTTYADLIRDAFNGKWTGTSSSASPVITFTEAAGGTLVPSVKSQDGYPSTDGEYTLMEANFSFFFGLALQAYQAELVSDETPFDRFVEGDEHAISSSAKNGLDIFLSECASCHRGPTFSNATVSEIFSGLSNPDEVANHGIIERMPTALELAAATVFFSTGEKPYMPGVAQLDLNFDPQGKSVEVVAAGTNDVYFEGTLSDSSPSCSKHSTSLSLSTTSTSGLSNFKGATADGEFQVFDNCGTSFRVTVESAPAGSYDVRVDGVTRGTLEVLPPAVYDQGFYNIAVRPTGEDLGIGGTDPFGNPLSFSEMELLSPGRDDIRVGLPGGGLGDGFEFDPPVGSLGEKSDAPGAFKTPILRNIALTAPYMHNGGMLTLRQVVEFYNRGGDFADENLDVLDPDIEALYLSESEIDDVVAFMETLTDERVVNQSAPFDHPELLYPEGHSEVDGITLFNVAVAVGANGGVPIRQFLDGSTVSKASAPGQIAAVTKSNESDTEQPYEYGLEQNYPNPFNPTTSIRFSLTKPINVTLEIFNVLGQHVKTLVNNELGAGFHTVTWDGTNDAGQTVASGVYLYRIQTPNFVQSRTMTFQK